MTIDPTSQQRPPARPLGTAFRLIHDRDAEGFRQLIHRLTQTGGQPLAGVAELLRESVCKQGPDFLKQLLETARPDPEGLSLVEFLTGQVFPRFPHSPQSRRLLQRAYLLYKNLALDLYEASPDPVTGQAAYAACCAYADAQDADTPLGQVSLLSARSRAVELLEDLVQRAPSRSLRMQLAQAQLALAVCFSSGADSKSTEAALNAAGKALQGCQELCREEEDLDALGLLAQTQSTLAGLLGPTPFRAQGEALYRKALTIRRTIARQTGDDAAKQLWAEDCGRFALWHCRSKGEGRREQAIALLEGGIALLNELPDKSMAMLADFHRQLGDLYADSPRMNDWLTAFHQYKAAAVMDCSRRKTEPGPESLGQYLHSRYGMAFSLWRVGGEGNWNTALHILDEISPLLEQLPADAPPWDSRLYFLRYALEDKLWIHHPLSRQNPNFHKDYPDAYACGEILEVLSYLPARYQAAMTHFQRMELLWNALPFYRRHLDPKLPLKDQEIQAQTAAWVKQIQPQTK